MNGQNKVITIMKGDVLNLQVNSPGHPIWIKTAAVTGTASSVTTVSYTHLTLPTNREV